jgi:hypothetical protein
MSGWACRFVKEAGLLYTRQLKCLEERGKEQPERQTHSGRSKMPISGRFEAAMDRCTPERSSSGTGASRGQGCTNATLQQPAGHRDGTHVQQVDKVGEAAQLGIAGPGGHCGFLLLRDHLPTVHTNTIYALREALRVQVGTAASSSSSATTCRFTQSCFTLYTRRCRFRRPLICLLRAHLPTTYTCAVYSYGPQGSLRLASWRLPTPPTPGRYGTGADFNWYTRHSVHMTSGTNVSVEVMMRCRRIALPGSGISQTDLHSLLA